MKKVIILAMVAFFLTACGKKEDPPRKEEKQSCPQVRVIMVQDGDTLMETTDEWKFRYLRSGVFGSPGDQFRYCH